jgi:ABC-type xylose transport system substrate-binding protein
MPSAPTSGQDLLRATLKSLELARQENARILKDATERIAEISVQLAVSKAFLKRLGVTEEEWQQAAEEMRSELQSR